MQLTSVTFHCRRHKKWQTLRTTLVQLAPFIFESKIRDVPVQLVLSWYRFRCLNSVDASALCFSNWKSVHLTVWNSLGSLQCKVKLYEWCSACSGELQISSQTLSKFDQRLKSYMWTRKQAIKRELSPLGFGLNLNTFMARAKMCP